MSKGNAMLRLGRIALVAEDLPVLETIAEDQKSPALGAEALLLILKVNTVMEPLGRGVVSFERVRTLVQSGTGVTLNRNYKVKALLALAEARLRSNEPADAEYWINQALTLQRRDDGSLPRTLHAAITESLVGVSLMKRGQAEDALERLSGARDDLARLMGPDHPTTHLFGLNTAIALETLGRHGEALAVVDRAELSIRRSVGSDAPIFQRLKQLQVRLQRAVASEVRGAKTLESGIGGGHGQSLDFFS